MIGWCFQTLSKFSCTSHTTMVWRNNNIISSKTSTIKVICDKWCPIKWSTEYQKNLEFEKLWRSTVKSRSTPATSSILATNLEWLAHVNVPYGLDVHNHNKHNNTDRFCTCTFSASTIIKISIKLSFRRACRLKNKNVMTTDRFFNINESHHLKIHEHLIFRVQYPFYQQLLLLIPG